MSRFNQTKFNYKDRTIEVGPGLTWGKVYEALNSTGVNVVGGRIAGVGVAGLTLGGGERLLHRTALNLRFSQVIHLSQVSMDSQSTMLLDMNSSSQMGRSQM